LVLLTKGLVTVVIEGISRSLLNIMDTNGNCGKARWHVTLDLVYEGGDNDSCHDGVERIRRALNPIIENGSGIKQMFIMRLPEKELFQ
jgi:hypothetical protein